MKTPRKEFALWVETVKASIASYESSIKCNERETKCHKAMVAALRETLANAIKEEQKR